MENDLLARVLGIARTVTPIAAVSPARLALPQLQLGQAVQAQVVARLADGSFRVNVNDTPLKLALPAAIKPGEDVILRLLARTPRLEFELLDAAPEANFRPSAGARLVGHVVDESIASSEALPASAAKTVPGTAVESPQTQAQTRASLSGSARLLSRILNEPAESAPRQARPVTDTPSGNAEQLRAPLARAVEESGLFYESHQARWVQGDYSLESLRAEPQAALAPQRAAGQSGQLPNTDRGSADAVVRFPPPAEADPDAVTRLGKRVTPAIEAPVQGEEQSPAPPAREALPIVRQQLEALETRQIVWHGELWPGLPLRWEIGEREAGQSQSPAESEWLTRLVLRLPALGEIGAALSLSAQGLSVAFTAAEPRTAAAMHAAMPELRSALEAAGLAVAAVRVRDGERV